MPESPPSRNNRSRRTGSHAAGAVFLTTISTILGAILFLRFGYAVAHATVLGAIGIVLLGHLVTVPTSLAIAEIATNQRVEGGGVYFMISRSFGLVVGGTIGTALFLSQAISVAFYVIAFSEAFRPLLATLGERHGSIFADLRWVSVPAILLLTLLMVTRGAGVGLKALAVVVATLFVSLAFFLLGTTSGEVDAASLTRRVAEPDDLFTVFAIVFPAFTGLTAGVGLSGDLRDPKRAIPWGTLTAVALGLVVYLLVAIKLATFRDLDALATDPLVMSRIALWGPIIPIGLACATLSSALGSVVVAPRTLQALAQDGALPTRRGCKWLSVARERDGEPVRASLLTCGIALLFVALGDINSIAQVISMFFMVTYGAICLISLLEQFAADPSYRPSFRSRWWISLIGAVLSAWLMFQMSPGAAIVAVLLLLGLYRLLRRRLADAAEPVDLVQGAVFQLSRRLQLALQAAQGEGERVSWRPSVVALAEPEMRRTALFDLLRWIGHRHGFATYLGFVKGYLSKSTHESAEKERRRLIQQVRASRAHIHVDTMVSPSYTSAFTQLIQLPGISGKRNNLVAFEYEKRQPEGLTYVMEHYQLAAVSGFDTCILGSSERAFGYRQAIHVWLTPADVENANLIIMLAYIIQAHPDWRGASILVRELVPPAEREAREEDLRARIRDGRLPIAQRNVQVLAADRSLREIASELSREADLTIVGYRREALRRHELSLFEGWEALGDVLFCNALREIEMDRDGEGSIHGPVGGADEIEPEPEPEVEPGPEVEPEPGAGTGEGSSDSPEPAPEAEPGETSSGGSVAPSGEGPAGRGKRSGN